MPESKMQLSHRASKIKERAGASEDRIFLIGDTDEAAGIYLVTKTEHLTPSLSFKQPYYVRRVPENQEIADKGEVGVNSGVFILDEGENLTAIIDPVLHGPVLFSGFVRESIVQTNPTCPCRPVRFHQNDQEDLILIHQEETH